MRTSTARNRHLVLSGLLGLSAITAALFVPAATFAASSTGTTTTATTTTTCDEGRWPASLASWTRAVVRPGSSDSRLATMWRSTDT